MELVQFLAKKSDLLVNVASSINKDSRLQAGRPGNLSLFFVAYLKAGTKVQFLAGAELLLR
jgi:hypothetical protein